MCLLILPGKGEGWDLKRDNSKGNHSNVVCIMEARSFCGSMEEKGNFWAESSDDSLISCTLMAYHCCQPSNGKVDKLTWGLFFLLSDFKEEAFLVLVHFFVVICFIITPTVIGWTQRVQILAFSVLLEYAISRVQLSPAG